MTRDYGGEMRALIDAAATGTYVPGVVAHELVEKLRANDPKLLSGWLDFQAENFVREAINHRDRSERSHARYARPRSVFAADAEAAEAGEPERLQSWLDARFTIQDGNRTPLRDMTREDLIFAGSTYDDRARENKLTATFLKVIAKKVGTKTVGDHFTDEQLAAMWDSLSGH